jgi:hypothetical protein
MDIIHQVVLSNTPSFTSNSIFIDILKPKDAKRCFMCVDKFVASYTVTADIAEVFEVRCDAVQNSYRYSASTKMVTRSDFVDSFLVAPVPSPSGLSHVALFNVINNKDNWLELDMNRLPQIKFAFVNSLAPGAIPTFFLHLKFKFTE